MIDPCPPKRRRDLVVLATGVGLFAAPALAQQAPRTAVPIREVAIRPAGTPRYAVTITVNGVPVETGLDTGSVGLRILPRMVARAGIAAEPPTVRYSYGSGVQLDGHRASVGLAIGEVCGQVPVQAIERISCVDGRACPAARVPPDAYGLMGSGQPNQGFQAIMGTRLNGGDVPNPLIALGVRRWIVHLPPRGGSGGVLILNPDARDVANFVPLRRSVGIPGTVAGCVGLAQPGAARICGPTLLDTGATELHVRGAAPPPRWQGGVPAVLGLPSAGDGMTSAVAFRTGDEVHGARARFGPAKGNGGSIAAGVLPLYAYDVLFDQDRGSIAVRPNRSANGAVQPIVR